MDPSDDRLVRMFPRQFEDDGTLLFVEEEGLESDSFEKAGICEEGQILRNIEDGVLIANPTEQADAAHFEIINQVEMEKASGIRFNIHIYKDTVPRGYPVAFSTQWNNTTYYMYVEKRADDMRVAFKSGNLPTKINGEKSDILFFKRAFGKGSRYYMFESTLEKDHFLAFEKNGMTSKLIVKKTKAKDQVDETVKIRHAAF